MVAPATAGGQVIVVVVTFLFGPIKEALGMKYGILALGAALLLVLGLATARPALAGRGAQTLQTPGSTPGQGGSNPQGTGGTPYAPGSTPGLPGNGAPPGPGANGAVNSGIGSTGAVGRPAPAPPNLVAREQPESVGFFVPVCLIAGLLGAGLAAFISIRRDNRKAERIAARKAAAGH